MQATHLSRLASPVLIGAVACPLAAQLPLEPRASAPSASDAPYWTSRVVDLDGDGAPELVMFDNGAPTPARLVVYHNDGHGVFDRSTVVGTFSGAELAAGDLDGDGDLDLVSGTGDLFWNQGGVLRHQALASIAGVSVRLGDFDGDGDLDIYLSNWPAHWLFRNDGAGAFVDVSASLPSIVFGTGRIAGDFDGDGITDLAMTSGTPWSSATSIEIWLGQRQGGLVARAGTGPVLRTARALAAGDLDGDGDLDLLAAHGRGPYAIEILTNDGTGTFSVGPGTLPTTAEPVVALALTDLDGDGDLDGVAGFESGSNAPQLLTNDGTGALSATPMPIPGGPVRVIQMQDLDRDGDADAFLATGFGVRFAVNAGRGSWLEPGPLPFVEWLRDGAVGEFTGDDFLDFVALQGTGTAPTSLRLTANRGDGTFTDAGSVASLDPAMTLISAFDADADGDDDLFVTASTVAPILLRCNGDGTFTDVSAAALPSGLRGSAAAAGDVDGDGDVDLVTEQGVLRNDGSGTFARAAGLVAVRLATCAALGDFDADGDLDAFVADPSDPFGIPQPGRLFENDGTGTFSEISQQLSPGVTGVTAARFADLDGDGREDLVVQLGLAQQQILWSDPGSVGPGPTMRSIGGTIAIADLDGDGVLDAVGGDTAQLGSPTRAVQQVRFAPDALRVGYGAWAGDFDRDGDADLIGRAGNHAILLVNLRRQLARLGEFRTSRQGRLRIDGPPGSLAVLGASLQRLPVPTPPGLWIDPGATWILGVLPLGANGSTEWNIAVPAALGPLPTFYAQAVLLTSARIEVTNHEVVTLHNW